MIEFEDLATTELGGFKPGESLYITVAGARTVATTVLPPNWNSLSVDVLLDLFKESLTRLSISYAQIYEFSVSVGNSENSQLVKPIEVDEIGNRLLNESEMTGARSLTEEEVKLSGQWLDMHGRVSTYLPNSTVYLIAESNRLIVGSAKVNQYGRAELFGSVPLELLDAGAHRFRIVGIRLLNGVYADADGNIKVTENTMSKIRTFDNATTAIVRIGGSEQELVRYIPLPGATPWWWLLSILLVAMVSRFMARARSARTEDNATQIPYGIEVSRDERQTRHGRNRVVPILLTMSMAVVVAVAAWFGLYLELIVPALIVGVVLAVITLFSWRSREAHDGEFRGWTKVEEASPVRS